MSSDSRLRALARADAILQDFSNAVERLADALMQPETEFIRDAAIQRFEFSFELSWKSIQAVAKIEAQDSGSPRGAISLAWRNGWIGDEAAWLDMLEDRNITSHTYHESVAKEVFARLTHHIPQLKELYQRLLNRLTQLRGPGPATESPPDA